MQGVERTWVFPYKGTTWKSVNEFNLRHENKNGRIQAIEKLLQ